MFSGADPAGWQQSQEFLNINIHNEQVKVEKVQREESHESSEFLHSSTPTATVTSTTPNSTQNNDDSSDKHEEIEIGR